MCKFVASSLFYWMILFRVEVGGNHDRDERGKLLLRVKRSTVAKEDFEKRLFAGCLCIYQHLSNILSNYHHNKSNTNRIRYPGTVTYDPNVPRPNAKPRLDPLGFRVWNKGLAFWNDGAPSNSFGWC